MSEVPQCQSDTPPVDQPPGGTTRSCGASGGCTCSPTTGICAACRRAHRIAYGLVGLVAAITAAGWFVVWLLDR